MTRATIVCLCGSTRFQAAYEEANRTETLAGKIVLSAGCFGHASSTPLTEDEKARLDLLHLKKIDMADEVLILNVGGYVGESTRREIEHARKLYKPLRWLEKPPELTGPVKNQEHYQPQETPTRYPLELCRDGHICLWSEDGTYKYTVSYFQEDREGGQELLFVCDRPLDRRVNWEHFRELVEQGYKMLRETGKTRG